MHVCFCRVRFRLSVNKPRDWLGSTSRKWPILCRGGRKPLTQSNNINLLLQSLVGTHPLLLRAEVRGLRSCRKSPLIEYSRNSAITTTMWTWCVLQKRCDWKCWLRWQISRSGTLTRNIHVNPNCSVFDCFHLRMIHELQKHVICRKITERHSTYLSHWQLGLPAVLTGMWQHKHNVHLE